MSNSIIALALLAASSTALLDFQESPRLRRRLGKGKSGKGGKGKYYGKGNEGFRGVG